jgi:hypothetical protein
LREAEFLILSASGLRCSATNTARTKAMRSPSLLRPLRVWRQLERIKPLTINGFAEFAAPSGFAVA